MSRRSASDDEAGVSDDKPIANPEAVSRRLTRPILPKRFYKEVSIGPGEGGGHALLLDGRTARTPAKNLLAVRDAAVAEALAAEWEAQAETIDPSRMPLTRLVNTALDRVVDAMEAVRADLVTHAGADLICYRAEGPEGLIAAEDAAWAPLVDWARDHLGARLVMTRGIVHVTQDEAAMVAIARAVEPFDALGLAALHTVTTLTGSAVIGLALARGRLTPAEAWAAAHVDEDWQMAKWGTDDAALTRRAARFADLAAAALILDRARDVANSLRD
ncbi:ATP12 family chaperone protein [Bauldia litoralis]|uniref:ATP12 family chaperone protein n=1 Tax=Bauldia litoralis TaxID=665467 RepID=UPI003D663282